MLAPSVSVLMPSYNCARYLPEAIESVLAQDFRDFELVILDDRSTDSSNEVLESYARRDERIRYRLNERNLGLVENSNACLREARGKYVKFLHSDDKLTRPTALAQMLALLEGHPDASLAVCGREIIDENSQRVRIKGFAGRQLTVSGAEAIAQTVGTGSNLIGEPSCVLFRRADAERGFDPHYRQLVDLEMWFHLLRSGGLVYTPECLCAFRRHDRQQSKMNRVSGAHANELSELVTAYADTALRLNDLKLLAAWSYRLRRLDLSVETQSVLQEIDARLGTARPLRHFVHALGRPLSNLKRRMRPHS
jgi:glycosyltransferase involved in cell wall biosynthesis